MSTNIHPTAVIEPGTHIGADTVIGPYTVIENDVTVGDRCIIGPHVMLGKGCRIGDECRIFKSAAIGLEPQDKKFDNEKTYTFIGKRTVLREFVTVNRGTVDRGETRIGDDCWIMAYCHVAHDCLIGNNVTISNGLAMAGHVEVGNHVTIGGIVPIHQFTRIGDYAIVGAVTRPFMDVVPFSMVGGETETRIVGINKVGLERHGFSEERRADIKRAFKILFRDGLQLADAITLLCEKFPSNDDIKLLVDFLKKPSKRGIMRMAKA
ncbi:MAG: acyl-ACP--UDP-N-acetylglucosamine O-acyltransferase [Fibrobacterota bacterium]|nr:acyl-ACP--UDP-N-acetylglucosamine O-acyltransferase [Chitinispirillaceae bacterium]